jgi:hypothetical protein
MKLIIDAKVYAQTMFLVNKCDKEISGLGKVKVQGDIVRVTKMYLLKQRCTGSSTDIEPNAVSELLFEAYNDGGIQEGELLWWWHSHVDMGVFWSGTDMSTIKEFGGNGRIFATVFNKKAEMKSAYFQAGTDVYPQVFVDNIETTIDLGLTDSDKALLTAEFEAKVNICKPHNLKEHRMKHGIGNKFAWQDDMLGDYGPITSRDELPTVFDDPDFWYSKNREKAKTGKYDEFLSKQAKKERKGGGNDNSK